MRKLGNPLVPGSFSYMMINMALTIVFGVYCLSGPVEHNMAWFFLAACAGATVRGWLKYSKLQYQKGHRFIGDD